MDIGPKIYGCRTPDPDAYLMIENNMRGGIATISHRHAASTNPLVEGYDPNKPSSCQLFIRRRHE